MRSPLTIWVRPTLPHSLRICRTDTSRATSVTRPSRNSSFSSAARAGIAVTISTAATVKANVSRTVLVTVFSIRALARRFKHGQERLALLKVVDNSGDDVVECDARFVADRSLDFADVGYPTRHVFEARLVRLIVGDQHNL